MKLRYADDPADAEAIREAFDLFVGHPPSDALVAKLLAEEATLGSVEKSLLGKSREHQRHGPVIATTDRAFYDQLILAVPPARLLFQPISKVANTSIKDWIIRLSGHDAPRDVHTALADGRIKLQAGHLSRQQLDGLLREEGWLRVAIVRDPFDRLVSCYLDKFVRTRTQKGALGHTEPVYRHFSGGEAVRPEMLELGLTFRQFCHYINIYPREIMDPHWAPQARFLESYRFDVLFPMERLGDFERFVLDRCPPELQDCRLGKMNAAPRAEEKPTELLVDTPPIMLDGRDRLPTAAFMADDIVDFVRDYYALDYLLVERARDMAAKLQDDRLATQKV